MKKTDPPKESLQEFKRPRQKTQIRLRIASVMGCEQQAHFKAAACALLAEILRQIDQPKEAAATIQKGERL